MCDTAPVQTPDGLSASKYAESREMEDAGKDPFVDAVKGPNTDSKPGPRSEAVPGPDQNKGTDTGNGTREGASQGARKDSAEGSGSDSASKSANDANRNAADETVGKPPAPANADGSQEPTLDTKMQKLVEAKIDARLKSLLESHLEPLLAVNRQVALLLGEQLENMIALRHSVRAMERLLEADPRRKSKYAATLEKVKGEGAGMEDPHWINRTRGILSRLERAGTLGPKQDDGPAKA